MNLNSGTCPKCGTIITTVRVEDVDVIVNLQKRWKGITYCCPSCNGVLSVAIDPVALKTDTVEEILGKR